MSKKEEEEEQELRESNQWFEQEIKKATTLNQRLQAVLERKSAETRLLRSEIQHHNHHQKDLQKMFTFERQRAKQLPRTWFLFVVVHFVMMMQHWAKFRAIPFLVHFLLFFLQWRRMYLPGFEHSGVLSVLGIVVTMYFWRKSGVAVVKEAVATSLTKVAL